MKKLKLFLLVLPLMLINCSVVKATSYDKMVEREYISDVYIKIIENNGGSRYHQSRFIRRLSDDQFVYCLEALVAIDSNAYYEEIYSDYLSVLKLTDEQWDKINLYAYYGYGYGNHTDSKWYSITQVLIWRTILPELNIGFTKYLNSSIDDNLFKEEINELEYLVSNHNVIPSFVDEEVVLSVGDSVVLVDSNNVLDEYGIGYPNTLDINRENNSLEIIGNEVGLYNIGFEKIAKFSNANPIVYFSSYSQNTFTSDGIDPVMAILDVEVVSGNLTILKLDKLTTTNKPSGDASLYGAKYGIYDSDNNYLDYVLTNEQGEAVYDNLPIGDYYIQELEAPEGYLIDTEKYYFSITVDNLNSVIIVYEEVISSEIVINKYYKDYYDNTLYPENNAKFDIYDSNNKFVRSMITDSNGYAKVSLPYGKYTFIQVTSKNNYDKVDDFEVIVDENSNNTIEYNLVNEEIVTTLKLIKVDADTGEVIKIAGIKFKLYDLINNEYVCLEDKCVFETNNEGILVFDKLISMGHYRIEEVDDKIMGYLWNDEPLIFELNQDNIHLDDNGVRTFEVEFSNKRVLGNLVITKYGEKISYIEYGFTYDKILLENVKFDLYAGKNIYSSSGKLLYSKDEYISSLVTDEKGMAYINGLELGNYYLIEKTTTLGHVLTEDKIYFDLVYDNQYEEIVYHNLAINNYLPKGKVEFLKLDIDSNIALKSTYIAIYNLKDEIIYRGYTDDEGKILIDNLPPGKYYLKELAAPNGYSLSEEIIEFEIIENETTYLQMYNKLVSIPDTFSYSSFNPGLLVFIIGIILICSRKYLRGKAYISIIVVATLFTIDYKVSGDIIAINDYNKKDFIESFNKVELNDFEDVSLSLIKNTYSDYIEIPKLSLKHNLYFDNDEKNNVEYNVEVINGSNLPNYNGGTLFLAGHSGNGNNAFFNDIDQLTLKDEIYIEYNFVSYKYIINDIYYQNKNGTLNYEMDFNHTNIVLITCDKSNKERQLVIIGNLI